MNEVGRFIESLYKDKYGQLISLMLQKFRSLPFESVEDIVQDSFSEAAEHWPVQGIPDNPSGWLYQICRNKSINLLKRNSRAVDSSLLDHLQVNSEEISETIFKDAQLLMLFACCHPNLAPKTQVALALKYVTNLKVENIALQLGIGLDAVEKMLYRARQKIKDEALTLSGYYEYYSTQKLSVVHKVIYLIFNEGYNQPGNMLNQGKRLCEEALMLNKFLLDSSVRNPETKALQALMLFNIARFKGRYDEHGKFVELEYQDRNLWDHSLIRLAHQLLIESESKEFSPYHLEAAIAFKHCSAITFEDTDWASICRYYEALLKIYPSPFAEINYAVALQYNHQDEKGYRILKELSQNPYYNKLPILNISLQKYYQRTGDKEE